MRILLHQSKGSEEVNIVSRCEDEWPGAFGGYDFVMVEWCVENQSKAYRALQ